MNFKKFAKFALLPVIFISCRTTANLNKSDTEKYNSEESGKSASVKESEIDIAAQEEARKAAIEEERKAKLKADYIESLSNTKLSITKSPKKNLVGKEFSTDFEVFVEDGQGTPLADYPLSVSYPAKKENGEIIFETFEDKTDAAGKLTFKAPRPEFSAKEKVTFTPVCTIDDDEAREAATKASASADWIVRSDVINKGAVLFVWDYNEKGRPVNNSYEILQVFRSNGYYNFGNAPVNETSYIGKPLSQIYSANYEYIGGTDFGYLICGTVKFSKPVTPNDDGTYSCTLSANISAVKMKDGSLAYDKTFTVVSTGKNWNDCVSKGKGKVADLVYDGLIYGL